MRASWWNDKIMDAYCLWRVSRSGLEDRVLTGVIFITIIKPPSFLSPHNSSLDDVFQRYAHYSYQKRFWSLLQPSVNTMLNSFLHTGLSGHLLSHQMPRLKQISSTLLLKLHRYHGTRRLILLHPTLNFLAGFSTPSLLRNQINLSSVVEKPVYLLWISHGMRQRNGLPNGLENHKRSAGQFLSWRIHAICLSRFQSTICGLPQGKKFEYTWLTIY